MSRVLAWVVVLSCMGCDPDPVEPGTDAGAPSGTDAGAPSDAGNADDAGSSGDAGPARADAGLGPGGPLRVIVLGSSTAEGKNLDEPMYGGRAGGLDDRYSVLFEAHLDGRFAGSVVENVARAGASTFLALPTATSTPIPSGLAGPDAARNVDHAIAWGAHAIIVHFPSPRDAQGETRAVWVANHREIIDAAASAGVEGWVALPNPAWDPAQNSIAQGNRDALVAEFGDRALDFYSAIEGSNGAHDPAFALTDTAHHPNAAGNMRFHDVLVAADLPSVLGWMD